MFLFLKKKQRKHVRIHNEKIQKESPTIVILVKNCLKLTSIMEWGEKKNILIILYSALPTIKTIKIVSAININSVLKFFITIAG